MKVSDSGFSADFVAYLQGGDVEYFANGLAEMYQEVGFQKEAELQCHEPGIFLKLKSDKHGHVLGEYEFVNETSGGFQPKLSGIIDMDQSYLPEWEKSCRQFLSEIGR